MDNNITGVRDAETVHMICDVVAPFRTWGETETAHWDAMAALF